MPGAANKKRFAGDVRFTYQGLSGPVILTVSNHWQNGEEIIIDWLPVNNLEAIFGTANRKDTYHSLLVRTMFKRLLRLLFTETTLQKSLCQLNNTTTLAIIAACHYWPLNQQKGKANMSFG